MVDGPSRIRRQVYELTISDLGTFPAWEFALDEEDQEDQDEATVRPYLKRPVDPGDGLQVVKATFTLADGTKAAGFVSPHPPMVAGDLSNHQPTIVTERGPVAFYFGMFEPTAERVEQLLGQLGKSGLEVFPLRYEADVDIVGGRAEGMIPGFCYMKRGADVLGGEIAIFET